LFSYVYLIPLRYYLGVFARTFALSDLVTAACVSIGVPEAYVPSRLSARWRAALILVVIDPLLVSVVVRTLS